jgi:hypothetical protein
VIGRDEKVQRFYVDGWDDDAVRAGYDWLLRFATNNGFSTATLFSHQKQTVQNLDDALAPRGTRLYRDGRLVERGITVAVNTARSQGGYPRDPVLALWADDHDLLDRLDKWPVPSICAIPWGDSIANWKAKWTPTDIRTGNPAPADYPVLSPVVVKGLETITALANLSNGLDRYNRDTAIDAFRLLHAAGEQFDPRQVRAWAARNGWGEANAAGIEDLAQGVLDGRRFRSQRKLRDDIVDRWRDAVGGDQD